MLCPSYFWSAVYPEALPKGGLTPLFFPLTCSSLVLLLFMISS